MRPYLRPKCILHSGWLCITSGPAFVSGRCGSVSVCQSRRYHWAWYCETENLSYCLYVHGLAVLNYNHKSCIILNTYYIDNIKKSTVWLASVGLLRLSPTTTNTSKTKYTMAQHLQPQVWQFAVYGAKVLISLSPKNEEEVPVATGDTD